MSHKIICLNKTCPSHSTTPHIRKIGKVYLKSERVYTQRYKCMTCSKTFVASKIKPIKKQKEKYSIAKKNVQELYCNGMTIRAITNYLKLNRKTIERKLEIIANESKTKHANNKIFHYKDHEHLLTEKEREIKKLEKNPIKSPLLIFDEMETHEHTPLKPLSIGIAYDAYNDQIIDIRVCRFKPRGKYKEILKYKPDLKKKYEEGGFNYKDERKDMAKKMFVQMRNYAITSYANKRVIITDGKTTYPKAIKEAFKDGYEHQVFLSKGIRNVDDSEVDDMLEENGLLKDPEDLRDKTFFSINAKVKAYKFHYLSAFAKFNKLCALMRLKLAVLHRKSFCTTKKIDNLQIALYVFQDWYNSRLVSREMVKAGVRRDKNKLKKMEIAKAKRAESKKKKDEKEKALATEP